MRQLTCNRRSWFDSGSRHHIRARYLVKMAGFLIFSRLYSSLLSAKTPLSQSKTHKNLTTKLIKLSFLGKIRPKFKRQIKKYFFIIRDGDSKLEIGIIARHGRDGRKVAEGSGLENRRWETILEFESLSFRQEFAGLARLI